MKRRLNCSNQGGDFAGKKSERGYFKIGVSGMKMVKVEK